MKLAASLNQRWMLGGRTLGMLAALNYTNEYRTYENMENNLYGINDAANDKPNYLRHSVDDQYNNNVRLGAMLNFTFLSKDGNHKYQLKKIYYKQFAEVTYADGSKREVEEISRCYKPGRNIGLSASYKF